MSSKRERNYADFQWIGAAQSEIVPVKVYNIVHEKYFLKSEADGTITLNLITDYMNS